MAPDRPCCEVTFGAIGQWLCDHMSFFLTWCRVICTFLCLVCLGFNLKVARRQGCSKGKNMPQSEDPLFGKPFVLSMGPQKCGNEWLEHYFRSRKDVCMPDDVKEIFYFDRHVQRGPEFYISHFDPREEHKIVIEFATTIFDAPLAPEHVFELFGRDLQLLCPLRHPVRRAIMAYQDYMRYGLVKGSIQEVVEDTPQILNTSYYSDHLKRWLDQFGAEHIKFLFAEDMEANARAFIQNLCKSLSLSYEPLQQEPLPAFENTLLEKDLEWLEEHLGDEILKIENLCGFSMPKTWHSVLQTAQNVFS